MSFIKKKGKKKIQFPVKGNQYQLFDVQRLFYLSVNGIRKVSGIRTNVKKLTPLMQVYIELNHTTFLQGDACVTFTEKGLHRVINPKQDTFIYLST